MMNFYKMNNEGQILVEKVKKKEIQKYGIVSLNKKEYRIPMCVPYNCYKKNKVLYSITANMLYPNSTLTLWETPAMIAALPPLALFFSISIFLLFFSSLLPSLSSRLLLSSQVRHWRIATLSPWPTYLLTYLRSPSTKYQVQIPLIPGAYEHWLAPYTWKHATTGTTCPTPGWANQCPTYTRYIGRGLDLVPRLWALEGERL